MLRIALVMMAALSLTAEAQTASETQSPTTPEELTMYDHCDAWSDAAERVMQARQEGMPMRDMMGFAQGNNELERMIIDAYDTPRFHTSETQQRVISDFTDTHYLHCIRVFRATE